LPRKCSKDLRNYRSIAPGAGNPQSTMIMGGWFPPAATVISGKYGRAVGFTGEDQNWSWATARFPEMRGASCLPGQTPVVRRTGTDSRPLRKPPKKKKRPSEQSSWRCYFWGVICLRPRTKIRPVFRKLRAKLHDAAEKRAAACLARPPPAIRNQSRQFGGRAPPRLRLLRNRMIQRPGAGRGVQGPSQKKVSAQEDRKIRLLPKWRKYKGRIERSPFPEKRIEWARVESFRPAGNTLTARGENSGRLKHGRAF